MKIYIFNTTILTTPGLTYRSRIIGVREARSLVFGDISALSEPGSTTHFIVGASPDDVISAIGHASTAAIAAEVLGRPVPVNRIEAQMQAGDIAVCVKLRGRPPEGVILSREQVQAIGYDLVLLEARDPVVDQHHMDETMMYLAWLTLPDDTGTGEQRVGTRRRGTWPIQQHFIVRLHDGTYRHLTQDWGTDEWHHQTAQWCLRGVNELKLADDVADLRFTSSDQAWDAAEKLFRGLHWADGPHGIAAGVRVEIT